jgi:FkbM family methyltransferase
MSQRGVTFVVGVITGVLVTLAVTRSMGEPLRGAEHAMSRLQQSCLVASKPAASNVSDGAPAADAREPAPAPPAPAAAADAKRGYVSPLLALYKADAESFYAQVLKRPSEHTGGLVVEVGSHDGEQAAQAHKLGYQVVVLEPSPKSFDRVKLLERSRKLEGDRFRVHQIAASSAAGNATFFAQTQGGTGDHISLSGAVHKGEEQNYKGGKGERITVPTLPLDDVLGSRRVYMLKVDTQGHELHVLKGAERLFREQRVSYAIFEFWPKQMTRAAAVRLLELLDEWGYDTHFTFPVMDWKPYGDPWKDFWLMSPPTPAEFVAGFGETHLGGLGDWTDIVAVCRRCVRDNMMLAGAPLQLDPAAPLLPPTRYRDAHKPVPPRRQRGQQ